MASTVSTHPLEKLEIAPAKSQATMSALLRWIVPSFSDLVFILLIYILAFSPVGLQLFNDADTGWHIRTGEQIVRTWSVPRVDSFSYTMAGRPWYAWEWLYDTVMGAIHMKTGLVGVRVLTALVIALTFALLYKLLAKRAGNAVVAVFLTVLGAAAAQVHMLARPHVITWLFTFLFLAALYGLREGKRKPLLWLPVLMVLWVNSHGGFVMGPALIAIFFVAEAWQAASAESGAAREESLRNLRWLGAVGLACATATLITPYGYKLHLHVVEYLRSRYIMDHNLEFQSPNFHEVAARYFEWLLLLTIATVAVARRKLKAPDVLLLVFGTYLGLYATRNVPIAAIMLTVAIAPAAASLIEQGAERSDIPEFVRRRMEKLRAMSERMTAVQRELRGHAAAAVVLIIACVAAWGGGRIAGQQAITASFNEKRFPVAATDEIASLGIHEGVFSLDSWGGYLIYRLSPSLKVYGDDRHDFYGEAFVREFVNTAEAKPGWAEALDKYRLNWVLMPPGAPLSAALRQNASWKIVYSDSTAVLFGRK